MVFKKLTGLSKLYLKFTNRAAYKDYKKTVIDNDFYEASKNAYSLTIDHVFKEETHFKHSGNSGDIIYSLPAVFAICGNGKAHMHLYLDQKGNYSHFHPLGNSMLTEGMLNMLRPLLLHQPKIATCDAYTGQAIDYDLDLFRDQAFLLDRGHISRWYFNVFNIDADLCMPWLIAPKEESLKDYMVIARSHRHRCPGIDYSFLKKYKRKIFIGLPVEYEDMKLQLPEIEFRPVKDFLEMASIINGCALFIGNQTFAFSLAEGLKVKRLLELYYASPNVIVEGKGGHDFFYQPHFEQLVEKLYTGERV